MLTLLTLYDKINRQLNICPYSSTDRIRSSSGYTKSLAFAQKASDNIDKISYTSLYLSRIEGPPPKRNAPGSNPGRDATKNAESLDFSRFSALLFCRVSLFVLLGFFTVSDPFYLGCGLPIP